MGLKIVMCTGRMEGRFERIEMLGNAVMHRIISLAIILIILSKKHHCPTQQY
jgi:hypothetical protein